MHEVVQTPPAATPHQPAPGSVPPDIAAALRFLKLRLLKQVELGGQVRQGLAETDLPFNDSRWFWTDDNAKALELLAQPAIWNSDPAFGRSLLDFLLAMSPGALIWRRFAEPMLKVERGDPLDFFVITPFHSLVGNLARGKIGQGARFNDDRGRIGAEHTGNIVQFRIGLQKYSVDIEDTIVRHGLTRGPAGVTLFHESDIAVPGSLLGGKPRKVAVVRYEYAIDAASPVLRLRVAILAEPQETLTQVRITTASDGLSRSDQKVQFRATGAWHAAPRQPGAQIAHRGPLDHLAFHEAGLPGHAYSLHQRPLNPEAILSLHVTALEDGRPNWCMLRYQTERLRGGERFAIEEERLLIAGGSASQAPHYAELLEHPERIRGIDPSISYDYGAELNGVATLLHFAARDAYDERLPAAEVTRLREWFDRHLEGFFATLVPANAPDDRAIFLRGLGFVALALDTMHATTGESRYETNLAALLDLLLERQQSGRNEGLFFDTYAEIADLDNQAAAILVLMRLLRPAGDARLVPAFRRLLGAFRMGTLDVAVGERRLRYDTVVVRSQRPDGSIYEDGLLWSFKPGLLLRAMRAVLMHRDSGLLPLPEDEWDRVEQIERACLERLAETARERADGIEHLTGPYAGETNSETQPWVLLGLLAPAPQRPSRGARTQQAPLFLGDRLLAETRSGRRLFLHPADQDLTPPIAEHGIWRPGMERLVQRLLRPGMVAADLGAGTGYLALAMAEAVGPEGRVHAFEPDAEMLRLAQASAALNGLADRIHFHHGAVLDRQGTQMLAAAPGHRGSRMLRPVNASADFDRHYSVQTRVPALTLDAALAGLPKLDLLHMDIEGGEALALAGASGLIGRSPELCILLEWRTAQLQENADLAAVIAWFAANGFRFWQISETDGELARIDQAGLLALGHAEVLMARAEPERRAP